MDLANSSHSSKLPSSKPSATNCIKNDDSHQSWPVSGLPKFGQTNTSRPDISVFAILMSEELSQWLAQVRLEMIAPMLSLKHVTSIESIQLLTLEDVTSIKESLPMLTAKRFQKEFIDKFGPFHSPKQEPQMEAAAPPDHLLSSKNGKEVGEFVANTSEDLDQYLDAKRIEHELALEEECLEFLIDIIAQEEESPTLYSKCAFDEGAKRRVCLSRDAHTARLQRLRKYRSRALERERLHPLSSVSVRSLSAPPGDKDKPTTTAASSEKKVRGALRVTIDPRFFVEQTDEGRAPHLTSLRTNTQSLTH